MTKRTEDYYEPMGSLEEWEQALHDRDVVIPRREANSRLAKIILGAIVGGSVLDLAAYSGVRAVESYYLRKAYSVNAKLAEIQKDLDIKVKLGEADAEVLRLRQANEGLITEYGEFVENVDARIAEEVRKANAEREEKIKALESEVNEFYEREKANPAAYSLGGGSQVLDLARTIFPESRGEWGSVDYQNCVGSTVLVRRVLTGKDLPRVIGATGKDPDSGKISYAYSFMNPNDPMHKIFLNPLKDKEFEPWSVTFDRARSLIGVPYKDLSQVTHFYVNTVDKPKWANGREPVAEFELNGKKTSFFYIPDHFKKSA